MAAINPYLTFNGNCEEAFLFYQSVFGGEISYMGRFKDMPTENGMETSADDANKIMHVAFPISKETVLMGSDTSEAYGKVNLGTNFAISVNVESIEEADKIFNGLSAGGKVQMPMEKTFWGAYFGMFTDKFGINWMVNFDSNESK